jgi:hypothetical protein
MTIISVYFHPNVFPNIHLFTIYQVPIQDQRQHLQRLCWAPDGSILTLLTSHGILILFDGNDLQMLGSIDLKKHCSENFAHGGAGLFVRKTGRAGGKIYEAIAATFSGEIHRLVIPMDSDDPITSLADFVRSASTVLCTSGI